MSFLACLKQGTCTTYMWMNVYAMIHVRRYLYAIHVSKCKHRLTCTHVAQCGRYRTLHWTTCPIVITLVHWMTVSLRSDAVCKMLEVVMWNTPSSTHLPFSHSLPFVPFQGKYFGGGQDQKVDDLFLVVARENTGQNYQINHSNLQKRWFYYCILLL